MDYFNIGNNLYLLTIIIRMFIGIILISKFLKIRHKQTVIILYYSIVLGEMILFVTNDKILGTIIGLLIGGILGIILSKYGNKRSISEYIVIFINVYAIIEAVFYHLDVNFSGILKTYDDIYVDYKTIYAKIIVTFILSNIILVLVKLKRKDTKNEGCLVKAIGAYYIIAAIFSNTMHPLDEPDAYFDFWLPLLNVNYSPYYYIIPEIFLIIVLAWILKKIYLEDNVK